MTFPFVAELFNAFDSDRNGSVDFGELASGLTMLCGTTEADRAQFMFKLLDTNGDGTVSLEVCMLSPLFSMNLYNGCPLGDMPS